MNYRPRRQKTQIPTSSLLRPSSASANLQSHPNFNTTSLYDTKRSISSLQPLEKDGLRTRPVTHSCDTRLPKLVEDSPRALETRRLKTRYGSMNRIDIYQADRALDAGFSEDAISKRLEKVICNIIFIFNV